MAICVVVIGVSFGVMWRKGILMKIRDYVGETQEELRKCTWPSRDELKGSTVVVVVAIALLSGYTVAVDWVLSMVMRLITA